MTQKPNMGNEQRETYFTKDQLQCLIGPRTRDVFDVVRESGEMTASEIQAKLGFESKSVYYQIKKLIAAGLLAESHSDRRRAAVYRILNDQRIEPAGQQRDELEKLAAKSVAAQLRKLNRNYSRAAAMSKSRPELLDLTYSSTGRVEISRRNLPVLRQRYAELMAEMRACECDDDIVAIQTLFLFTPEVPASESEG